MPSLPPGSSSAVALHRKARLIGPHEILQDSDLMVRWAKGRTNIGIYNFTLINSSTDFWVHEF